MEQSPLQQPPVGAIRFNTDSSKLEYYDGNQWVNITSTSPQVQTGGTRFLVGGGGSAPTNTNTIEYFNISTTGDSLDFGDLSGSGAGKGYWGGGFADRTRGVWTGSYTGVGRQNNIVYVTIASTGDALDFGDCDAGGAKVEGGGFSNATRGVTMPAQNSNGSPYYTNAIDYLTIQHKGNTQDFGDARCAQGAKASFASPTRGVFIGGTSPNARTLDYIQIMTTGNSAEFGSLSNNNRTHFGLSNSVRGLLQGYSGTGTQIDYYTIATLGGYTEFGDSTQARNAGTSGASSTRGVFAGGAVGPTGVETTDYVEIMTTGDAIDFGDLEYGDTTNNGNEKGFTNGHGGLG